MRAIFYEQQVRFAEGPAINKVVHVENGTWLYLPRFVQQDGPYPPDPDLEPVPDSQQQPYDLTVAKQISVPHGNSVLALGSYDTRSNPGGSGVCERDPKISGSPVILDVPFPYPMPAAPDLDTDQLYTQLLADPNNPQGFQNPHPILTQCPIKPLQQAVAIIEPNAYMHWHVTTEPLPNGRGHVTNIPFEQRKSKVTAYRADYWLLSKDNGATFQYLAYIQTILMQFTIGEEKYIFPHVTCNTVTRKSAP